MLYLAFFAVIAASILLFLSNRQRKDASLPKGKVIYTDTRKWGDVESPLFEPDLKLTGKPDYLVKHGNEIIPVEVKSSRVRGTPYTSHVMQLAAYCMLVEREYSQRPSYGIIKYPQKGFRVDYTNELENQLLNILAEMRRLEIQPTVKRKHKESARCKNCGYRSKCNQALISKN